jgi:hypothetical protein
MVLDDNQPSLKADVALLFDLPPGPGQDLRTVTQYAKGHGRVETRSLSASIDLKGYLDWPAVEQALCLERRVFVPATGQTTVEVEYGLLSLAPDQIDLPTVLARWRGHWSIENRLHWSRDVVMAEDASQVRSGHAPQALAALRNTVISLVHCLGHASLSAARRHFGLNLHEALSIVGIS